MWIEVVGVSSFSTKLKGEEKHKDLKKRLSNFLNKLLSKSNGQVTSESLKIEFLEKPRPKISRNHEKKGNFTALWDVPKEINNFSHLVRELKRAIEEKSDKWKKKENYKDLKRTALWTVLSTAFLAIIQNRINKEDIITTKKTQEEFIHLYLVEKVYEDLKDTEIKFPFLIITFLSFYYSDEKSFLDSYDPLYREKREKVKEKNIHVILRSEFWKDFLPDSFLKLVIPTLYIPVVDNKIIDLTGYIKEKKRKFREKWKLDFDSFVCEGVPSNYALKF